MLGVSVFETESQGVELFVLKLSSQRFSSVSSVLTCYKYWKQFNQCKFPEMLSSFTSLLFSFLFLFLLRRSMAGLEGIGSLAVGHAGGWDKRRRAQQSVNPTKTLN